LSNNIAWVLATHPDDDLRDGALAVQLASAACRETNREVRTFLDTLAAAFAETGDFDAAVRTCRESLRLAQAAGDTAAVESARARLQRYEDGRPYRDATLPRSNPTNEP
jgi:hypothetical protein